MAESRATLTRPIAKISAGRQLCFETSGRSQPAGCGGSGSGTGRRTGTTVKVALAVVEDCRGLTGKELDAAVKSSKTADPLYFHGLVNKSDSKHLPKWAVRQHFQQQDFVAKDDTVYLKRQEPVIRPAVEQSHEDALPEEKDCPHFARKKPRTQVFRPGNEEEPAHKTDAGPKKTSAFLAAYQCATQKTNTLTRPTIQVSSKVSRLVQDFEAKAFIKKPGPSITPSSPVLAIAKAPPASLKKLTTADKPDEHLSEEPVKFSISQGSSNPTIRASTSTISSENTSGSTDTGNKSLFSGSGPKKTSVIVAAYEHVIQRANISPRLTVEAATLTTRKSSSKVACLVQEFEAKAYTKGLVTSSSPLLTIAKSSGASMNSIKLTAAIKPVKQPMAEPVKPSITPGLSKPTPSAPISPILSCETSESTDTGNKSLSLSAGLNTPSVSYQHAIRRANTPPRATISEATSTTRTPSTKISCLVQGFEAKASMKIRGPSIAPSSPVHAIAKVSAASLKEKLTVATKSSSQGSSWPTLPETTSTIFSTKTSGSTDTVNKSPSSSAGSKKTSVFKASYQHATLKANTSSRSTVIAATSTTIKPSSKVTWLVQDLEAKAFMEAPGPITTVEHETHCLASSAKSISQSESSTSHNIKSVSTNKTTDSDGMIYVKVCEFFRHFETASLEHEPHPLAVLPQSISQDESSTSHNTKAVSTNKMTNLDGMMYVKVCEFFRHFETDSVDCEAQPLATPAKPISQAESSPSLSTAARIEGMVPMKLDDFFKHFEAKSCAASVASLGGEHTVILKQDTATSKTLT